MINNTRLLIYKNRNISNSSNSILYGTFFKINNYIAFLSFEKIL